MLTDTKVNLFIVGAAKAGTTTVFNHLAGHPQVCMSAVKEPNYFSSVALKHDKLYYNEPVIESEKEYHKLFNPSPAEHIIGEGSVSYLYYPGTAAKIFDYNPKAKIIILLRDPVDRAFSHYLMDRKLGLVPYSFDEILQQDNPHRNQNKFFQQYIRYGLYSEQVKSYFDIFPATQVKIILFHHLQDSLQEVLNELTNFLNLDSSLKVMDDPILNEASMPKGKLVSELYQKRFIRKALKTIIPAGAGNKLKQYFLIPPSETLSDETKLQLKNFFRADIMKLESLINQKLEAWYE